VTWHPIAHARSWTALPLSLWLPTSRGREPRRIRSVGFAAREQFTQTRSHGLPLQRKDYDALLARIEELASALREAGQKGLWANQSAETWHDNFGYEEEQRQEWTLSDRLEEYVEMKNDAEIVQSHPTDEVDIRLLVDGTAEAGRVSNARETDVNWSQVRDRIDRGETGDKIAVEDPATAPLGTDAEAGGSSTSGDHIARSAAAEQAGPAAQAAAQTLVRPRRASLVLALEATALVGVVAAVALALVP
jgi:hypothetical protein